MVVLLGLGHESGLFDAALNDLVVMVVTISMALTPLVLIVQRRTRREARGWMQRALDRRIA